MRRVFSRHTGIYPNLHRPAGRQDVSGLRKTPYSGVNVSGETPIKAIQFVRPLHEASRINEKAADMTKALRFRQKMLFFMQLIIRMLVLHHLLREHCIGIR